MHAHTTGLGAGLLAAMLLGTAPALAVPAEASGAVNVRSGPGTGYDIVDQLVAGEDVDVVECNAAGTWCRIVHSGPDGWVSRSYLDAPADAGDGEIEWGVVIPLPGGGSITFGSPGFEDDGGGDGGGGGGVARACFYDLPNYAGASACVDAGTHVPNLPGVWNNRITSLQVEGGASVTLCQNPAYGGFCNTFGADVPMLGGPLNNQTSSYDVTPPALPRVCVYDLANFQGDGVCVNAGASDTGIAPAWNNRVTSIRIFGGAHIRLCQNPNYGGFCNVFAGDVPTLGGALNDQGSSYQTW